MVVTDHTKLEGRSSDLAKVLGVYGKGWKYGSNDHDLRDGDTGILLSEVLGDTGSNDVTAKPSAAILLDRNGAVVVMHRDGVRPLTEAVLAEMASKQGGLRWSADEPADGKQVCEGHCLNDADCAGDLKCYQRNEGGPMPFCFGTPYTRIVYQYQDAPYDVPIGYCYQDVATIVTIEKSDHNSKCITHSVAVLCDTDAGDLGKRTSTHKAADTFVITTNGKQVCARRTDSNEGWGMNLKISCKRLGK